MSSSVMVEVVVRSVGEVASCPTRGLQCFAPPEAQRHTPTFRRGALGHTHTHTQTVAAASLRALAVAHAHMAHARRREILWCVESVSMCGGGRERRVHAVFSVAHHAHHKKP